MSKICVIGGCGFVGSNIVHRLKDHDITVVDNLQFGYKENIPDNVKFVECGFEDLNAAYWKKFDTIIFVACCNIIYAIEHPIETFYINAWKSIELFQKFHGRIIYTSTASVYGNSDVIPTPETATFNITNAYDQSKLLAEEFLRQRGNYTTLRLSNVYGTYQRPDNPYCGVIGKLLDQALKGEDLTVIGDGKQTRDFTYVDDVVNAVEKALYYAPLNTEVNIATGIETSIKDLAETILKVSGGGSGIKYVPQRKIDGLKRRCLDIWKAQRMLNWKPEISLEKGLCKTIEFLYSPIKIDQNP